MKTKLFLATLAIVVLFNAKSVFATPAPWFASEVATAHIHDPSIIRDERGVYTIVSTNNSVLIKQSNDMRNWTNRDRVVAGVPQWARDVLSPHTSDALSGGDLWAPNLSYFNGRYWAYYCYSATFGRNFSTIGVASNPTLDYNSSNYNWTDHGEVVTTTGTQNYNAIDPEILVASDGRVFLYFGSYWSGLKAIEINPQTGKPLNNTMHSVANNRAGIEAPGIIYYNGFYYLFVAYGVCCQGVESTYSVMVGRGTSPTGPFFDKQNRDMMNGYAEELVSGYSRYFGPGHGSPFVDGNKHYFTHHYYDGNRNGFPTMQARRIVWDSDNWPILNQPFLGRRNSFEAEHADVHNAQYTQGENASNGEYIGYINEGDSRVVFHMNVFQSGSYKLRVRYAAGLGDATHNLTINSNSPITVNYPETSSWGEFPQDRIVMVPVELSQGYNRVELRKGEGFAELDRIDLIRIPNAQNFAAASDHSTHTTFSFDDNAMPQSTTTNPGGYLLFENLDFENGGYNYINLNFNTDYTGDIILSLDDVTNQTISLNSAENVNIELSNGLKTGATGVKDVYIRVPSSAATMELSSFAFLEDLPTGVVADKDFIEELSFSTYPNPFNPVANISFNVAKEGVVKIEVFDVAGKKIADIANEYLSSGRYSKQFNGSNLPSGVYFIRLNSSGKTLQKRVVLLK